jgi:hypothetical protein
VMSSRVRSWSANCASVSSASRPGSSDPTERCDARPFGMPLRRCRQLDPDRPQPRP